jgi:dihydroorotate dehydrogenase (fumarate)
MSDLAAVIAGARLEPCLMNAAGPGCTTLAQLTALGASASGAIVTKSMTLAPRTGNAEPRYRDLPLGSLNSMGLPNLGVEEYCRLLPRLRDHGKPVVASVAALEPEELAPAVQLASQAGFDLVEANLSCPNLSGHPIVAYDMAAFERVLLAVRRVCDRPLGVKLPPYFDRVHQEQAAAVLVRAQVDFITLINSVPNALLIDLESETPLIHPKEGFGGLGGAYVKPVALANTRAFYSLTGGVLPIIGVGGVYSGRDAAEFLLAGASAVQIGTAYAQEGTGVFGRIAAELDAVLAAKGARSAAELVGRLRPLPAAEQVDALVR